MSGAVDELSVLAARLRDVANQASDRALAEPLERLTSASISVGESWSGSPIGYHARVYYENFAPRPVGASFSSEWGFMEAVPNYSAGEWREFAHGDVVDRIRDLAGRPDLADVRTASALAREALNEGKADAASVLTAALAEHEELSS